MPSAPHKPTKAAAEIEQVTTARHRRGWEVLRFRRAPTSGLIATITKHNEVIEGYGPTRSEALQTAYERAGFGVWRLQVARRGESDATTLTQKDLPK